MQHGSGLKSFEFHYQPTLNEDHIIGDWEILRQQLLNKWQKLTAQEVDNAGPSRKRIASLVAAKYGIASICVENYIYNYERQMPL